MTQAVNGALPNPGQILWLDAAASPEFSRSPFDFELTEPPRASTLDAAQGLAAGQAKWILVTGWVLDDSRRRVILRRDLPVRRCGIVIRTNVARSGRRRSYVRR